MTDTNDQSFIRVKYGDNQEAIFNPWCSSYTLMEWIRKKCNCENDILIDLVDMDGQVKNLSARTKEYASEVVNPRETYVLIRVEIFFPEIGDGKYNYTSLLNNLGDVNPDLFGKLSVMSRPQTRVKGKKNNKPLKTPKGSRNESATKRPKSSEKKK
ncbi:uncharacterized protein LOC125670666 isoform X1 [Ostrea edulis]|uniref:uncharacterized protein LOC125670666 isoform X1 n=1 Tax=Ostrea edulis TaxID=37623 RepID=UPI002094E203|nr:uncharacterized protein LOC125670666 isoform X1 [Ostrea edulis]